MVKSSDYIQLLQLIEEETNDGIKYLVYLNFQHYPEKEPKLFKPYE